MNIIAVIGDSGLFEKNFDDYSTSEGLLFIIALLLMCIILINVFKKGKI